VVVAVLFILFSMDADACLRDPQCDELPDAQKNAFSKYFNGMRSIYGTDVAQTSVNEHMRCGWGGTAAGGGSGSGSSSSSRSDSSDAPKKLPLFVLSVGLEGAGHHLYSDLFAKPVFDCVWVKTRFKMLHF
jgi:hypothetical protein